MNEFSFRIISIVSIVESKHDLRDHKELYVLFYRYYYPFSFCYLPLFLGRRKKRERGSNFDQITHTILIIDLGHVIIVA